MSKEVLGKGPFLKLVTHNSTSTDKPKADFALMSPYLKLVKATCTNGLC